MMHGHTYIKFYNNIHFEVYLYKKNVTLTNVLAFTSHSANFVA